MFVQVVSLHGEIMDSFNPMYVECLETLAEFLSPSYLPLYEKALKRMQRYGYILERFISPEGYFPYIILSSDGT